MTESRLVAAWEHSARLHEDAARRIVDAQQELADALADAGRSG